MTRRKRLVFTFIMLCLPVLFLLVLEGGFRLFGLFEREPLYRTIWYQGEQVNQINQHLARRYFAPDRVTVPGLNPERFAVKKPLHTFRILCIGGSTTAGFPFDGHVTFPKQLRFLLSQTDPGTQFEVLNLGISAVNSFTFVDLLPELLDLRPDAVLIYMGHNEFYGAYGSASSFGISASDDMVRLYLKLQNWRVVRALQAALTALRPGSDDNKGKSISLMQAVVKDQEVPLGSPQYQNTLRAFQANMKIILGTLREREIPVILSNLVSNIRDNVPFSRPKGSAFLLANDASEQFSSQQIADSLQHYRQLSESDSTDALAQFQTGQFYLLAGDPLAAKAHLYRAKDHDNVRFRASEELNSLIAQLAQSEGAHFLDMHKIFANASPYGLIGADLMCDHLHPNPSGYYMMAQAFLEKLLETGLVQIKDPRFMPDSQPYFITDLDWDIGLLKIFEMVHSWPFPEKDVTFEDYQPHGVPFAAEVARHYLFEENVWSRAHYKMAEEWLRLGQHNQARRHYLAVSVFAPDDPYPYSQIANIFQQEGRWAEREFFLRKELQCSQNKGMVYYQIAMSQYKQRRFSQAIKSMKTALDVPGLDEQQKLNARFYLAGFYFETKQSELATNELQSILAEAPGFEPARKFLQQIQNAASEQK